MTRRRKTELDPAIHRVRLDKLTIFEITEAELEALERGSPESLYLNLGIAALSIASSFLISLLTTTIADTQTFCVFVIICAVGFVAGVTFALLWWLSRRSLKKVARDMRNRMPPEGIQEEGETDEQNPA
jgi:hypothetical protein